MVRHDVDDDPEQGVIDGGDLPIVNMKALKIYEGSKYASLTYHNYGPTNAVMNLEIWNGLSAEHKKLIMDLSRAAQEKIREMTESVDNFAKAKSELEPLGMTVVEAKVDEFRLVSSSGNRVMLELVLHEGRKHVVRRMLEAVGHPVQRLVRTAVGPVLLGDQRAGKMRPLTPRELAGLFDAVGL